MLNINAKSQEQRICFLTYQPSNCLSFSSHRSDGQFFPENLQSDGPALRQYILSRALQGLDRGTGGWEEKDCRNFCSQLALKKREGAGDDRWQGRVSDYDRGPSVGPMYHA